MGLMSWGFVLNPSLCTVIRAYAEWYKVFYNV